VKFPKRLLTIIILMIPAFLYASESAGHGASMTHLMNLLVFQLAIIILVTRVFGYIFEKYLKQTSVLGELVSGMIIGPYALGKFFVPMLGGPLFPLNHSSTVPVSPELYGFAIVASIILLFLSGLETDLPTFLKFSMIGGSVGLGGVVVSFALGALTAVLFLPQVTSFMDPTALFLGTLATATSVGITARILSEKRKMSSPEGVTILAGAVLDDVLGIVLLAVVIGIAKVTGSGEHMHWGPIALIAGKAFGFWLGSTVLGILIAPKLTKSLKGFGSINIIAEFCFGLALLLAGLSELVGLAMIIGAYVMGLALSQTDMAHDLRESLHPVYRFFVPMFFCIMGMMVDFSALWGVLAFGLIYTAASIFGKLIGCGIPALLNGFNLRGAFRIGAGMLPRGEVTLIVAGLGLSSGIIGPDMFGVAIMTLLVNSVIAPPLLVKSFNGGRGYKSDLKSDEEDLKSIELSFGTPRIAGFISSELLDGFKTEEFFVHQINMNRKIFTIRKDRIQITMICKEDVIILNTPPENEDFVRLMILEVIVELKDLLLGVERLGNPDLMGADILQSLFDDD